MTENLFNNLQLKNGDKVLVSSDILRFLLKKKEKDIEQEANKIIDNLIEKIGESGTLLLPTYNWDFCKGIEFNYKKTLSLSGALGNVALKRKDFLRTKNPIYSFATTGKDSRMLAKLNHTSCFSLDSPFGYLIKNKGKNLFLDLDYKKGFTFCHVAEETVGVDYRYKKIFSGFYVDQTNNKFKANFSMFVRDTRSNVGMTVISEKFDSFLEKVNAIKKYELNEMKITIIDIEKAYNLMVDDIKKKGGLIYPKKN